MRNPFGKHTDATICIRFCLVFGLLYIPHYGSGLNLKPQPRPNKKIDQLPMLDRNPNELSVPPSKDYTKHLTMCYTNQLEPGIQWAKQIQKDQKASGKPLMLGFDVESSPRLPWKAQSYNEETYFGPALLQLSTTDACLILQIAQDKYGPFHEGGLPQFIHDLLNNPNIIPVGVGIDDDFVELYRFCLENGKGCEAPAWATNVMPRFDLGGIGKDPNSSKSEGTNSLKKLVANINGVNLGGSKKLARTHWSKDRHTKVQVAYAARDAWAGAVICEELAIKDPDRFAPEVIQKMLQDQMSDDAEYPLRSIQEISNNRLLSKPIKEELRVLHRKKRLAESGTEVGDVGVLEWTDEQEERLVELTKEKESLARTPAMRFEIEKSLGIIIP